MRSIIPYVLSLCMCCIFQSILLTNLLLAFPWNSKVPARKLNVTMESGLGLAADGPSSIWWTRRVPASVGSTGDGGSAGGGGGSEESAFYFKSSSSDGRFAIQALLFKSLGKLTS